MYVYTYISLSIYLYCVLRVCTHTHAYTHIGIFRNWRGLQCVDGSVLAAPDDLHAGLLSLSLSLSFARSLSRSLSLSLALSGLLPRTPRRYQPARKDACAQQSETPVPLPAPTDRLCCGMCAVGGAIPQLVVNYYTLEKEENRKDEAFFDAKPGPKMVLDLMSRGAQTCNATASCAESPL